MAAPTATVRLGTYVLGIAEVEPICHHDRLKLRRKRFENDQPVTTWIECEACGSEWFHPEGERDE